MIVDTITYNGERDVLDIRLNCLSPYVDTFLICEAKTTFSGNRKHLHFWEHERHFRKWWHKIHYYVIDENYSDEEICLAAASPNTIGAPHWVREFLQKESLHKAMWELGLKDTDTVYIGDVDEIWEPVEPTQPMKLKLHVYAYYLNNLSSETFWGPLAAKYGDIRHKCLNHMRTDTRYRTEEYHGCHFTSMGGIKEVQRKLNDSYTQDSYNTIYVQNMLPERVRDGTDYLGRPFTFSLDTSYWPEYLKKHHKKYSHLCKNTSKISASV